MQRPRTTWRTGLGAIAIVTGVLFVLSLGSWVPLTLLAPFVEPQRIERSEAGIAVALPLDWEHVDAVSASPDEWWDSDKVDSVEAHHTHVLEQGGVLLARTISPFVHHYCIVYDFTERAAEPLAWTAVVHAESEVGYLRDDPDLISASASRVELPAGLAVRIDVLDQDDWSHSSYYLRDGTRWARLECGSPEPPEDRWLSVADTLEFLPAASPASAAFQLRSVVRPDAGFALTLPYHWEHADAGTLDPDRWYSRTADVDPRAQHERRLDEGLLLSARSYHPDSLDIQWCDVEDATLQAPVPPAWATLEDFEAGFLAWSGLPENVFVEASYVDLPAGRALAVDSRWRDGRVTRSYVLGKGQAWFRLDCGTDDVTIIDRWSSVAETFTFLGGSADADDTRATGSAARSDDITGPIAYGGRLAVPSSRLALTVPDGWYAFDRSDPGLADAMQSYDPTTRWMVAKRAGWDVQDPDLQIEVAAPWTDPDGVHLCYANAWPQTMLTLDTVAAIAEQVQREEVGPVVSRRIELPAGPAYQLDISGGPSHAPEAAMFILLEDGLHLELWCAAETRHDRQWRSIADSLEVLPAASP